MWGTGPGSVDGYKILEFVEGLPVQVTFYKWDDDPPDGKSGCRVVPPTPTGGAAVKLQPAADATRAVQIRILNPRPMLHARIGEPEIGGSD